MIVEVLRVSGKGLRESLGEVARLGIEVFREYPYLYEGSEAAEQEYLESYAIRPGWRACLGWKQVDSGGEDVRNELVFWTKEV